MVNLAAGAANRASQADYGRFHGAILRHMWLKCLSVSNMADIEKLCAVEDEGIEGVICGRAIYSGDLDFEAAQVRADELGG